MDIFFCSSFYICEHQKRFIRSFIILRSNVSWYVFFYLANAIFGTKVKTSLFGPSTTNELLLRMTYRRHNSYVMQVEYFAYSYIRLQLVIFAHTKIICHSRK